MASRVESPTKISAVKATAVKPLAVKATPVDPTSVLDPTTPTQAQVAEFPVSVNTNANAVPLFIARDLDEHIVSHVYQAKLESCVLSLLLVSLILNVVYLLQDNSQEQLLELLP
jgi:hypothetical protein